MNTNTRAHRFLMWACSRIFPRDVWSPTLAIEGRKPSLRWCLTGRIEHSRKVGPGLSDGFRETYK